MQRIINMLLNYKDKYIINFNKVDKSVNNPG